MGALTCISDYLKLCGQSHNLRYVAMSVMWFMGFKRLLCGTWRTATQHKWAHQSAPC